MLPSVQFIHVGYVREILFSSHSECCVFPCSFALAAIFSNSRAYLSCWPIKFRKICRKRTLHVCFSTGVRWTIHQKEHQQQATAPCQRKREVKRWERKIFSKIIMQRLLHTHIPEHEKKISRKSPHAFSFIIKPFFSRLVCFVCVRRLCNRKKRLFTHSILVCYSTLSLYDRARTLFPVSEVEIRIFRNNLNEFSTLAQFWPKRKVEPITIIGMGKSFSPLILRFFFDGYAKALIHTRARKMAIW